MAIRILLTITLLQFALLTLAQASQPAVKQLSEQRELYLKAEQALRKKQRSNYQKYLQQLDNYPLLPYLYYADYQSRLRYVTAEQISRFTSQFPDTPIASRLQRQWLETQANSGQWQIFRDNYPGQEDAELQCLYLRALYHTGNKKDALRQVSPLWLVGKSQPKACDPLFSTWLKSEYFNAELAWQRFQLAMENGKYTLARYLLKYIQPPHKQLADSWYSLRRHPEKVNKFNLSQYPEELARTIVRYGVKRLARYDASKAWDSWNTLKDKYAFPSQEQTSIERRLALSSLLQQEEIDNPAIAEVIADPRNSDLQEWRIRAALSVGDWQSVDEWLQRLSPLKQDLPRWRYWSLRSAEALDKLTPDQIQAGYQQLAQERRYYSFLAADQINADYQIDHQQIDLSEELSDSLEQFPAFIRARELYALERVVDARREWQYAIDKMNTQQRAQAAKLAAEWGWHDRAILTVAQTPFRDDMELRFPLAHRQAVINESRQHQVDPAWVMAVIRQESAFMQDARSNRGALGLMQIMPRTGKEIGRLLKSPLQNTANLLQSDVNIQFGVAYLKRNLKRLQNNMVTATAAYNAGYGNVRKWLPKDEPIEADRWVETIRFSETRNYVQNIMAYAAIYDQRLGLNGTRLSERMPQIEPR